MKPISKGYTALMIILSAIFSLIILQHIPLQLDFTAQRSYTLSKGSKRIVKNIDAPIMIDYYYSSSSEEAPTTLKNFGNRIEVFLKQYQRHSNGMIQLRVIDPKPDTAEEEAAVRSGVQGAQLPSGETFFMGLTASQAEQNASIDMFSLQREPYLEYDISKLLTEIQRVDKPRMAIITSLPIQGSQMPQIPGMPPQRQQDEPEWSFFTQLEDRYDIQVIPCSETETTLDEGLDLLMVLHPTGLSAQLSFEIDQFVMSGRPVMIAVDPSSVTEKQSMGQQQMMMGMGAAMGSSDLPALFAHWGIQFDSKKIAGDLDNATRVSSGMGQAIPYPVWINTDNLSDAIPALAPLNQVLFAESGYFSQSKETPGDLRWTPVIRTSEHAAALDTMMTMYSQPAQLLSMVQTALNEKTPDADSPAPYALGGLLTGNFTTAYPDGKPKVEEKGTPSESESGENDSSEDPTEPSAPAFTEGKGTVFLLADTDCFADRFSVERMNFLGNTMLRPLNDNLNLVLNLADQLAGSQDLIELRGRGNVDRTFDRVERMEVIAQTRFQEQLKEVNNRLQEVQSEIARVQDQQQSDGMLIANDELKKAISDYREQEANAIAERREIRKKLREDIEALNRNLILINLLLVPGLLTVFGVRFFLKRNRARS